MTKIDLDYVRRLCDNTTPGPWGVTEGTDTVVSVHNTPPVVVAERMYRRADREFVQTAHRVLPELVDATQNRETDIREFLTAVEGTAEFLPDDLPAEYKRGATDAERTLVGRLKLILEGWEDE